jgi:hypothetical protein
VFDCLAATQNTGVTPSALVLNYRVQLSWDHSCKVSEPCDFLSSNANPNLASGAAVCDNAFDVGCGSQCSFGSSLVVGFLADRILSSLVFPDQHGHDIAVCARRLVD